MIRLAAGLLVSLLVVSSARLATSEEPAPAGLASLAWLEGAWEGDNDMGHWETSYTSPQGGSMLSSMKLTKGDKPLHFDFERWREEGGVVVMTPFPGGTASVDFKATEVDAKAKKIVLENPAHDFPRKFVYASPAKDRLKITLEGNEGGKATRMEFDLKRRKTP
jgi:hypothetical protein